MTVRAGIIWPVWRSVTEGLTGTPGWPVLAGFLVWLVITAGAYGLMCLWGRRPVRHWAYASRRALLGHWLAGDMDFRAVAGTGVIVLALADLVLLSGLLMTPVRFTCWSGGGGGVVVMVLFNTGRRTRGHHLRTGRALMAGLLSLQTGVMLLAGWMLWSGVSSTTA